MSLSRGGVERLAGAKMPAGIPAAVPSLAIDSRHHLREHRAQMAPQARQQSRQGTSGRREKNPEIGLLWRGGSRDRRMMQQQHSRKRQREHASCCRCGRSAAEDHEQRPLFLPTHLSLLRALHADDATEAGGDLADASCPRPSWVEINNFLVLQDSIINRQTKARRTKAILHALLPPLPPITTNSPATSSPLFRAATLPTGATQQQRQREPGIEQSRPLLVDPRAVVAAVLRNAVTRREAEHLSASAGLRGLRKGVDDTVDHLASSLDGLRRNRRDRAKPWSNSEEGGPAAHAADVVERHQNKLLLWRRLQRALTASRVGVEEGRYDTDET